MRCCLAAARRGLYAERRTFILFPSGESTVSSLLRPSSSVPPAGCPLRPRFVPPRPPPPPRRDPARGAIHGTRPPSSYATPELSHTFVQPLRPPRRSIHPISTPFASYQLATTALLLLSDYCAAVTAVCRSVCIRVIHFLGNISSCAA